MLLNEINCEGTDWIEIVNTGDAEADISGWLLTDEDPAEEDPNDPHPNHRLVFASGTVIPAHEDLTLDKVPLDQVPNGFPFGVSCEDTIWLAGAASGETIVDLVELHPLTPATETFGRYPSGGDSWAQTASTKGAPNQPSTAAGAPPPDTDWLFDATTVHEIDLSLPQASRDALAIDPETYVAGTFALTGPAGTYGPLAVGVRLKGHTSFRDLSGKAAFKIKFNHSVDGQRFHGLEKLTLNNMVQDASMLHEAIGYEAFRATGVAAPRVGFAYVTVDGDDYGVYANVETVDSVALARWFESTRHLYEGVIAEDVTPGGAGAFEIDEGNEDRSDLEVLIDAVADDEGSFSDRMDGVADLQQMVRMWATEKYIGQWDGYAGQDGRFWPRNYFLHSDATGVFSMLPWGLDQALSLRLPYGTSAGVLFDRCLAEPECAAAYAAAVADVRATVGALHLEDKAQQVAAVLEPWQAIDPRRENSLEQIAAGVAAARTFLAERPADTRWLSQAGGGGYAPPADAEPKNPDPTVSPELKLGPPLTLQPSTNRSTVPMVRSIVRWLADLLDGGDPDDFASARVIVHPYLFEEAGRVTFAWRVPRGAISDAKTSKTKLVTIASGALSRARPGWGSATVRLTTAGRRLLRRAHRVRVTVIGTFRPARTSPALTARRSFTLLDR